MNLMTSMANPIQQGQDADAAIVARVQAGDTEAFAELVKRHEKRVYRTLMGITGVREDAEDATQGAFLKAYVHLADFQGASRFSTWLLRIAINEGLERLRRRKQTVSIEDDQQDENEHFRPREFRDWRDNPEEKYTKTELRELVEREVMKLPFKYRVVVMLRDLEEQSTEETANALDLEISTVKTRLLRGRLMLREALAPFFLREGEEEHVHA
jgi:RNA polymerase sigma-70 factor (ECF subfamily)